MWIMPVCQFDPSPLEIFKDLRAQILSSTFISIGAISPMPCHDVPSGRAETFFSLFPHQIVIITLDTIALQWNTIALQWKFSNCYVKYMLLYMKVAKNLTVNR